LQGDSEACSAAGSVLGEFAKILIGGEGMTLGASPRPRGTLSWAGTIWRGPCRAAEIIYQGRIELPRLARLLALSYLTSLGLILIPPLQDPDLIARLVLAAQSMHVAVFFVSGTLIALLTLIIRQPHFRTPTTPRPTISSATLTALMAQMSHELRTPLNAVIGFADIMQHQLLGPLGNQRYQDYVRHIGESGGQLLKSAEEALAITNLMGASSSLHSDPIDLANLVRKAWNCTGSMVDNDNSLRLTCAGNVEITGDDSALCHAFVSLLGDSRMRGEITDVTIEQVGHGAQLTISPLPAPKSDAHGSTNKLGRTIAQVLLELQGASLDYKPTGDGRFIAVAVFAPADRRRQV
jgi:two-component system cell cycle sensor histidine kinase PleC